MTLANFLRICEGYFTFKDHLVSESRMGLFVGPAMAIGFLALCVASSFEIQEGDCPPVKYAALLVRSVSIV